MPEMNTDRAVRVYLLALRSGVMPSERPADCGAWANLVSRIEGSFEKYHGDQATMERLFEACERQYPQLADLLSLPCGSTPERDIGMPALPVEARLPPNASAGVCAWLDCYEAFSREASPEGWKHYHVFCGMWLLSTVAARRVYLPFRVTKLYTNLMIGLYGKSSEYMKTTTVNVAKAVLEAAGLDYFKIDGKLTPAKLLSDMAGTSIPADFDEKSPVWQENFRQELTFSGQRGLFFDELGKFVQSMLRKNSTNAEFASIFLELHNCPAKFRAGTIVRGTEMIEQPYLTLIGGMTPPNLKDNARSGADFWMDGFWGRFSFVAAPPPPKGAPITDATFEVGQLPIPEDLISPLVAWHQRLGIPECDLTELPDKNGEPSGKYQIARGPLPETEARITVPAYEAYKRYRVALKQLSRQFEHDDFSSSYARLPETALRMALLMASLENDNRIELRHWAKAQELAELLRQSLHEIYTQVNEPNEQESKEAKIEDAILRHLGKHGALTLNTLRTSYMKQYSSKQIETVLGELMKYGKVENFSTSHSTKYKLTEQPQEEDT